MNNDFGFAIVFMCIIGILVFSVLFLLNYVFSNLLNKYKNR